MFFAKIGSMAVSFFATMIVARHLGPTNYGQLSYAISFVGLFSFIAALGIDQILYRDLVKYPEKRNEYIGSALVLRMVASAVAFVLCIITAFIMSENDISLLLIFIVSLSFVFSTFLLTTYEFQATVQQKYPSILALAVTILLNILKILVILSGKGVIYLAFIIVLEPILYTAGYLYFRVKVFGTMKHWRFDKVIAVAIVKDSFPLIFASAFFIIYARIDQVMIKNMMDATSVGLYSAAVSISEIWYFIPHIITASLFPAIVNAKKVSEGLYYARIRKLFLVVLLVSFIVCLPTTLLSESIILLIFGGEFLGANVALQIYVWSNIGGILTSLVHQILITENLTKAISITSFFGMAANIILNFFLIPKYGIAGAATASMISYIVPILSLLCIKKSRVIILNVLRNNV